MSVAFLFCSQFVGFRLCLSTTRSGGTIFDFELDAAEDARAALGRTNGTWGKRGDRDISSLEFFSSIFYRRQ